MPGVPGRSGGTNIKRPEEKLGRPTTAADATKNFDRIDASDHPAPVIPEPSPEWDTAARQVWDSVVNGPQAQVYGESVDYAYLWIVCAAVDKMATTGYRAGQLAAVHAMLRELGMTEIQRRQAKILIDRTEPEVELAPVRHIDRAKDLMSE